MRFLNIRIAILLGAAVAGFLTIFLLTRYMSIRERQMSAALREQLAREGVTNVVVAERDIMPTRNVSLEDVKTRPWPKASVPKGAFHDVKQLEGRVAARRIIVGEPVLEGHLTPKGTGTGLASIIPRGKRAVAVRVNDIIGVAGFIKPGDLVDVIVTMEPEQGAGVLTKTVLQRVPVLAVGQEISREGGQAKRVNAVTLLVNPRDAEKLALASRSDIQLAMRSSMDKGRASTEGSTVIGLLDWSKPEPELEEKEPPAPEPEVEEPPPPITVEVIRGSSRGVEKF